MQRSLSVPKHMVIDRSGKENLKNKITIGATNNYPFLLECIYYFLNRRQNNSKKL